MRAVARMQSAVRSACYTPCIPRPLYPVHPAPAVSAHRAPLCIPASAASDPVSKQVTLLLQGHLAIRGSLAGEGEREGERVRGCTWAAGRAGEERAGHAGHVGSGARGGGES